MVGLGGGEVFVCGSEIVQEIVVELLELFAVVLVEIVCVFEVVVIAVDSDDLCVFGEGVVFLGDQVVHLQGLLVFVHVFLNEVDVHRYMAVPLLFEQLLYLGAVRDVVLTLKGRLRIYLRENSRVEIALEKIGFCGWVCL